MMHHILTPYPGRFILFPNFYKNKCLLDLISNTHFDVSLMGYTLGWVKSLKYAITQCLLET
jgi:hypothetical protein